VSQIEELKVAIIGDKKPYEAYEVFSSFRGFQIDEFLEKKTAEFKCSECKRVFTKEGSLEKLEELTCPYCSSKTRMITAFGADLVKIYRGEMKKPVLEESHHHEKVEPRKVKKKIGRNDPCPCGSGKKYKKCCGK